MSGSLLLVTLLVAWMLTARYFPVEADAANSPLVWRAFLNEGFSAFSDWRPTSDSWYFTTYPVNFIFFALLNDDGKLPVILSTALFVGLTSFILSAVIYHVNKGLSALFALVCLTLLPAYVYIYGFAAHPFSHYSTNFFGALTFALCFLNVKRKSLPLAFVYSIVALLSSVSDPWFLATYFLPLLLVHIYFWWQKELPARITITLAVSFIIGMTHLVQKLFGLPIQRFKIMPFQQWIENTGWVVQVMGKSLNLFFVTTPLAYIASFVIWTILFLYSLSVCWKKGRESRFVSLFSFLTVAGIISSFIISYNSPADISARFFVNAVCFIIALTVLAYSFSQKHLLVIVFLLFSGSSLYSYQINKTPLYDQEAQTHEFISFLKNHNLTFGYGDYWRYANAVNWLSFDEIHISPVLFDRETWRIEFDNPRYQTMKSWLTEEYVKNAPHRQFVAIPALADSTPGAEVNPKLAAIKNQLGEPDETLVFQDLTIFVYNHQIPLQ